MGGEKSEQSCPLFSPVRRQSFAAGSFATRRVAEMVCHRSYDRKEEVYEP
ncbi:MAG: hypothetical protein Q4D60_01820 [Eubacteriales bacterium]|nr:hypothetical protein [Eubacteriales bacterium]